ncbi:PRD domain-containing protein [Companilactobacillus nantensis]|uniref:Transcription antiterminator lacT n=1 Tax=Companilactobacillus nantensis DSM 16982 TaxID=1423774 RepID=A0A0R1WL87_9LACO|nr:PRD domain-containing protein [Companilactobacillus nantensis]KRM18269.1 transcription antiterminator lacT [Companilactobacillus nantensis DSM 16982]GEO62933.1 transcription antiterminator lact [Companilactobacillus nantensis]
MQLIIKQIFNNNTAVVELDSDQRAIIKGKGIAFNKSKGSTINSAAIEKIFYLDTVDSQKNLYFLLKDIPIDVVTTTYEIVDYAKKQFNYLVQDYIYITLSDHIYGAYKRCMEGNYTPSHIPDMSDKYIEEYLIASAGVNIINQNLEIDLPSSEIRNLALHFINAHTNDKTSELDLTKEIDFTKLIKKVLLQNNIFRTKSNRNYYDRFMVHLQYLEQRLNNMSADTKFDRKFELEMERDYPGSTSIAKQVSAEIKNARGVELNNKELLYFIIHIQRITQEAGLNDAR